MSHRPYRMFCLEALAHLVGCVLSWNDTVSMFEQQFMTQMSNWVTDMPFDVYFQVDDIYIFLTF